MKATQLITVMTLVIVGCIYFTADVQAQPPGRGGKMDPEEWVARLDKDGDGKVSESEFDGPSEHFSQFDQNGDGYIEASEVPENPPERENNNRRGGRRNDQTSNNGGSHEPPVGEAFISLQDQDHDGQVSRDEFRGPAEHFDRFDQNQDGYISLDEAPMGRPEGFGSNNQPWNTGARWS